MQVEEQPPVETTAAPSDETAVPAEPEVQESPAAETPSIDAPAAPVAEEAIAEETPAEAMPESPAEPVPPVESEQAAVEQSPEPVISDPPPVEAAEAESAIITEAPAIEPLTAPAAVDPAPGTAENAPEPVDEPARARTILRDLISKHKVQAISIGAGTSARELETALRQIIAEEGLGDILIAAVNDAGIAIYSSSRLAREEFPDWSASARCAVSLARRLQDPLAELVKIDPKLIGVGQYQHDVDQKELHRGLLQTVQYCINKVGVNVNGGGESLLRYVSGLNDKLARKLVAMPNIPGSICVPHCDDAGRGNG